MSTPKRNTSVMQTYVVRIYPQSDATRTGAVAGTVEPIPGSMRLAFANLRQLGAILDLPPSRRAKSGRKPAAPKS